MNANILIQNQQQFNLLAILMYLLYNIIVEIGYF